ncbi:MAG: Maf family protein, partial [Planctomycetes bacterium]|nr:Maf family protein [Planctomycetota bacterium]
MGKAGAYAIQEDNDKFVEEIEGSFSNVVGLPLDLLQEMLEKI